MQALSLENRANGGYMDKVTEVEIRLDGYHLHPTIQRTIGTSKCAADFAMCEGKLTPMVYKDVYVMVCEKHSKHFVDNGWKAYGQDH
jgi:hypothetical protein